MKATPLFKRFPRDPSCKGLVFGYSEGTYAIRSGFKDVREIRKLKSLSCEGCATCGPIMDGMTESPNSILFDERLMNGDRAEVVVEVMSVDSETGQPDGWAYYMRKI